MSKTLRVEGENVLFQTHGDMEGVVVLSRLVELLATLPDQLTHFTVKQNEIFLTLPETDRQAIYAYYSSYHVLFDASRAGHGGDFPELTNDLNTLSAQVRAEREKRSSQAKASSASSVPYQET